MPSTLADRIDGISTSLAIKFACRVATTADITLSGLQTVDDIALAADDRVFVKNKTNAADNGIWRASVNAWTRAPDFDGNRDVAQGTLISVYEGTTNARTVWQITSANPIVIGTDDITSRLLGGAEFNTTEAVVGSIALLKELDSTAVSNAYVSGYYSAGDGGGGSFWQDAADTTSADDGGIIIVATDGARWKRIYSGAINIRWFGAKGDGVTNDSAALIAARTAAHSLGLKIYIPAGHYKFNSVSSSTEDLIIEGDGDDTILDFTGTISGGDYALEAIGTATQIQELGANAAKYATSVTFASAPSLSIGDVFVIYNPTDSSFSGFRTVYRAGEWCEVESVSGSVVTLKNPLYDAYTAANVDVYKISGPRVELKNFAITGTTVLGLIKPTLCIDPLLENISGDHQNDSIVYYDRCFRSVTKTPRFKNIGDGGDDYGIVVGGSQHNRVYGGSVYARRHAITHGGSGSVCDVPNRDSRIYGAVLKNDVGSFTEAADFHGNTEDSSYEQCTIYGGANLQGKNNYYAGCKIYGESDGRVIYHAEVLGGRLGCVNCHFITNADPFSGGRGIYDIGGQNNVLTTSTAEDVTFFVENCRLSGVNLSSSTYFARMRLAGATVNTNIRIDGLDCDVDALGSILLTSSDSGTPAADFIIVDNIFGNMAAGVNLHSASGSAYTDFPHRLQRSSGKWEGGTVVATTVTASPITMRYEYPRVPQVQVTLSGRDGANLDLLGGQIATAQMFAVTTTTVRPMVIAPANFTNGAAFDASWQAEINEV